ncbi:hypothetical protein ACQ4LF_24375, partial [Aeromonas salmonicida]
ALRTSAKTEREKRQAGARREQVLSIPEARLVVVDPIPVGVSERLQEPGLWQHLPLVQQAPVLHLPAVWSFGGVLAARR